MGRIVADKVPQDRRALSLTALIFGPALFVGLLILGPPDGLTREAWTLTALIALMVIYWVTEAIPIPVTSLLPLVILPSFGVRTMAEAAAPFAHPVVMLLLGGFIIAKAIERWNIHERIALLILSRMGGKPAQLSFGLLVSAALLSAWISNSAAAIMLMPVALSLSYTLGAKPGARAQLSVTLVLSVAYGASIGGLATPIGTPTNLIVLANLESIGDVRINFAKWMMFGVPAASVLLALAWLVLNAVRPKGVMPGRDASSLIKERLSSLGPWSTPEVRALTVIAVAAFFWAFRRAFLQDLAFFGARPFAALTDHVIAVAGAIAMFLVPSGERNGAGQPAGRGRGRLGPALLDWDSAAAIPWGVLLLFGGGLSLAAAITATGLGTWLAAQMAGLAGMPPLILIFGITLLVIFATELTSNVATAAALMPVLLAISAASGADAAVLSIPVALAASCAFMFPMATAPNAIAFSSGEITIDRMARTGLKLNVLAALFIALFSYAAGTLLLG